MPESGPSAYPWRFEPEVFLRGRLAGSGEVRGPLGGLYDRFDYEGLGVWSDPHRALHYDGCVRFGKGRVEQRAWVLYTDPEGRLRGHDGRQQGELSGRQTDGGFRMTFSRDLKRPKARLRMELTLLPDGPGGMAVSGRMWIYGLPVASLKALIVNQDF